MNKDVIYIDTEDDITTIIGNVKDAKHRIVALVPPKNVGVLQSAVNLRLLARAAKQADKRLVLITNNAALTALAASAKLPIAKNLQSKPEIAQIPALDIDDGSDVIDGAQLPVGELARTADVDAPENGEGDAAIDEVIRDDSTAKKAAVPAKPVARKKATGAKVPDFNKFRKKLVLIIAGILLVVGGLIWAFVFAPHATVIIKARTTEESVNKKVFIGESVATSASKNTVKGITQQLKKDVSVEITATGTKDVGEKATGSVVFRNCETQTAQVIPAGTAIANGGNNYLTQAAVTVPAGSGGFSGCSNPGVSEAVGVVATDIGEGPNVSSGASFTVAGHINSSSSLYFRAVATTAISGGSKKQIKVVTADDVERATEELNRQNSDDIKKQLIEQFGKDTAVIDASFKVDVSEVKPQPAVDAEAADGKGKLTGPVTYTIMGAAKAELSTFLTSHFEAQIGDSQDQRIYDNGAGKVTFTNVTESNGTFSANMSATAKIGPNISDEQVKQLAKGKRYGEVQSAIVAIQGVDDVDIKFSYFWVRTVPNDESKISVEFNLDESN